MLKARFDKRADAKSRFSVLFLIVAAGLVGHTLWSQNLQQLSGRLPLRQVPSLQGIFFDNSRIILTGERGFLFESEELGETWTKIQVPSSVLMTGIFRDQADQLFIYGHESKILKSTDSGQNWRIVHEQMGEDLPLFHFLRLDSERLLALGAYGQLLLSQDEGESWTTLDLGLQEEGHWYDALVLEDELVGVGEFGSGFVWKLNGENLFEFQIRDYSGSLFSVLEWDGMLVATGLQGSLFSSMDGGRTWEDRSLEDSRSIYGAKVLGPDDLLLFGANGFLRRVTRDFVSSAILDLSSRQNISSVLALDEGSFLLLGDRVSKIEISKESR
ncbi:MAG: hypothetical protein EA369_09125 [Bradymonadales bacterium]|nr:MAG: hypothetical protein EA369_09125 [Bradymonadales bacterium]